MTLRLAFLSVLMLLFPLACATTAPPPEDDDETGGSKGTGGKKSSGGAPGSGGKAGSGGSTPGGGSSSGGIGSGGRSASGGGHSAGGSVTSGGSANGGNPADGGAKSGGGPSGGTASSGGSASGGAFSGACAGKPNYAAWKALDDHATGDQIVHQCTVIQSRCSGLKLKTDYLFECNQTHVPNCETQLPEHGSSWTYIGECSAAASSGGMGGEGS